MANRSFLDPKDEFDDEQSQPYSSVSPRVSAEDISPVTPSTGSPSALVKDRLTAKYLSGKDSSSSLDSDPYMQQYQKEQADLDQFRRAKLQADTQTNIGQALSQMALGANTPQDSGVFKNIAKQSEELMGSKDKDLDRRRKVMEAIEGRKAKSSENALQREYMDKRFQSQSADRQLQRDQLQQSKDLARQDRQDRDTGKKEEKELALNVPGYERTGEVLPKPEEAVKLRGALASADQLKQKLGRLKDLVNQYGSFEIGGEGGSEMESLSTEIQLLAKNKDMYDLGVLTGPDMGLLQKITADPSSIKSFFTRDSTRHKQIDTQLQSIENKLDSTAKSMGYKKKSITAADERNAVPSSRSSSKPKTVTQNGYTYTLNEATGEYE